ncbi:MAG: glycerophosphodiester phosphodiesterase family protein [Alphaproteobacteria bacterium]|nr:glycerophosphodiester phosphodiesterase family protein [Alphaproteobacteria bacterium]
MRQVLSTFTTLVIAAALLVPATVLSAGQSAAEQSLSKGGHGVQVGPRPYFLVEDMDEGELKTALQKCAKGPFKKSDFSIGHRGAALQFAEHTKESYVAAARMGAGIVECDVTFTKDRQLVCRHAQNDLATTTNILVTDLADTCIGPFTPATFDADGNRLTRATAECRTSEITLAEFKTLKGKMDASDPNATTPEEFLGGTADFRTDLYAADGTVLSHAESIALFRKLGVKFTPELKSPSVTMPFEGDYTQEDYAQQMIDEYIAAGIPPEDVWAQSFSLDDVRYWIANEPAFGEQAVFLDGGPIPRPDPGPFLDDLARQGVNIVAPPMPMLLTLDADNNIVPSAYAGAARAAGLDIITWTLERSGRLSDGTGGGFYYQSTAEIIDNDGDAMTTLDVLAQDVGILGIFSDWPGTVTYYASCMGLK